MALKLSSPAFLHKGQIPAVHTCDGEDSSPPLLWSGTPKGTQSFTLIVDDPDAPDPAAAKMTWVHWVLYNIPADLEGLPEAADLPAGALEGVNDWKRTGYGGPRPPKGRHRYFFKLYALDRRLSDLHRPTKAKLETSMSGHALAEAALIGTYQRHR